MGDTQLHPTRRIGFNEIDELPWNDAWLELLHHCFYELRRSDSLQQTPDRATETDIHLRDPDIDSTIRRFRVQVDVVDADDFTSMDVNDLLIEQVALQKEEVFEARGVGPLRTRN